MTKLRKDLHEQENKFFALKESPKAPVQIHVHENCGIHCPLRPIRSSYHMGKTNGGSRLEGVDSTSMHKTVLNHEC
jgi:hypothetical protein